MIVTFQENAIFLVISLTLWLSLAASMVLGWGGITRKSPFALFIASWLSGVAFIFGTALTLIGFFLLPISIGLMALAFYFKIKDDRKHRPYPILLLTMAALASDITFVPHWLGIAPTGEFAILLLAQLSGILAGLVVRNKPQP